MSRSCEQCGAEYDAGADCESCFHALLAYENERPPAFGAVHHLTVATYYLQHPTGYTHEALAHWRELIAKSLGGGASVRQLRELSSNRFAGSRRVRAEGMAAPGWWPRAWPMTVQAVFTPDTDVDVDTYVHRARAWAAETIRSLDAAQRAGGQ